MIGLKSSFKESGVGSIIILLLVLALIAGVVVFLFFRNQNNSVVTTQNPQQKNEEDLTTWKTYSNNEAGFSFKYPESVLLNPDSESASQSALFVSVEKLIDIPEDMPSLMGRKDALEEKTRLEKNPAETDIKIGSLYGNEEMVLSRFEVCSVILTRKLTFYPGDYRVIISLTGPKEAIMKDMPEFFTVDPANCGEQKMWNRSNPKDFNETLSSKQGAGAGQVWYDTFDEIVKTLSITVLKTEISSPIPSADPDTLTYKNDKYGFEISYPKTMKALTSKDDLYGYPNGILLLYNGGQAYDVVVEVWDSKSAYESNYEGRLSELTVVESNGKFITLLNNTQSEENKKVIDSFKLLK